MVGVAGALQGVPQSLPGGVVLRPHRRFIPFGMGVQPLAAHLGQPGQRRPDFRVGVGQPAGPFRPPLGAGDGGQGVGADNPPLQVGQRAGFRQIPFRRHNGDKQPQAGDLGRHRVNVLGVQLPLNHAAGQIGARIAQAGQRGAQRLGGDQRKLPGADAGVEQGKPRDGVAQPPGFRGVKLRRFRLRVAEQIPQLGLGHPRRGVAADGGGQRILDHFGGHIGRGVIGAGGHPVGVLLPELGGGDQIFKEVAQHFRVNRLVAFAGGVFGGRPVIPRHNGEQPRPFRRRAEVVAVLQSKGVIAGMVSEQGAVQKRGIRQGFLHRARRVRRALGFGGVEIPEQESQDPAVVIAAAVLGGEPFLKGFVGDQAVLLEDPGEHRSDQMPQRPLAFLAVAPGLLRPGPAGDRLVKLLADDLGGHRPGQPFRRNLRLAQGIADALQAAQR